MRNSLLAVFLLAATVAYAQTPSAICEVVPSWAKGDIHSAGLVESAHLEPIARFQVDMADMRATRSFEDRDRNAVITTAVKFALKSRGTTYGITVAIAVREKQDVGLFEYPDDVFEFPDSSVGSAPYRKNWSVSVTKNMLSKDRTYMWMLRCWDSRNRRPFFFWPR